VHFSPFPRKNFSTEPFNSGPTFQLHDRGKEGKIGESGFSGVGRNTIFEYLLFEMLLGSIGNA
jgi:hypothetical protein